MVLLVYVAVPSSIHKLHHTILFLAFFLQITLHFLVSTNFIYFLHYTFRLPSCKCEPLTQGNGLNPNDCWSSTERDVPKQSSHVKHATIDTTTTTTNNNHTRTHTTPHQHTQHTPHFFSGCVLPARPSFKADGECCDVEFGAWACLSVCLFSLSIYLSICLSIYLFLFFFVFVWTSLCVNVVVSLSFVMELCVCVCRCTSTSMYIKM